MGGKVVVSRLSEYARILWIETQSKSPPFVQRAVIPRLHEAKEIARLLARPYLPVCQLQGQGQGGPLTVTHIGLDYAKPFLNDLLFVEEPMELRGKEIPFWHYDELVSSPSSDLIIVEATRHLIRKLPRRNAAVLPQYVHHILDVRGDWQDVKSRFRKSVRHEFRLTRKYGYEYEVSHDGRDFELFYDDMYLPTMRDRHGALASPMPPGEAYQYFRHGLLFWVKRDGRRVCGSICQIAQGTVICMVMGVINGDQQLIDQGVVGALNCLRIQWANEQGYKAINFLGSGIPRLSGGMFQHKRKWGTAICVPPHLNRQIWIGIRRSTPAVSQFFRENPLIVVDEDGKLHGLITVDDPHDISAETKEEWEKRYATPGLSSLLIRSVNDLAGPSNRNDVGLVVPILSHAGAGD